MAQIVRHNYGKINEAMVILQAAMVGPVANNGTKAFGRLLEHGYIEERFSPGAYFITLNGQETYERTFAFLTEMAQELS